MYGSPNLTLISKAISDFLNQEVAIKGLYPVGGGSISSTFKIITDSSSYFLKINSSPDAKRMFVTEVNGLDILRAKSKFSIPAVVGQFEGEGSSYLIMDYIDSAPRQRGYWQDLAIKLCGLHKHTTKFFGLNHDNFIGSLPQKNSIESNWAGFFINQRLQPMVKMALDRQLLSVAEATSIESAFIEITQLMPKEPPALLHGDLWSGNLMVDSLGLPTLIDPAVYYGHREMDIAFSQMFGGFSPEFYHHYQEIYPLEPEFDQRLDLYNLYPLLVHLNLFGRSYFSEIKSIIRRIT